MTYDKEKKDMMHIMLNSLTYGLLFFFQYRGRQTEIGARQNDETGRREKAIGASHDPGIPSRVQEIARKEPRAAAAFKTR